MKKNSTNIGILTVLTVMLGTFMGSLDVNVVNMTLPILQSSFKASLASIEWVAVAYLLALGATQLTFGRLSDMLGHKKIYVSGFALFTLSSFACSLSPNLNVLILFRIIQALSAAMLNSSGSPLIISAVKPENRGKSLGMIAVAVAVATCVGPVFGGMLASKFGWRSIFLINIPIGVIGTILSSITLKKDEQRKTDTKFDTAGSILIIFAMLFILLPLNILSRSNPQMSTVIITLAIGITSLVLFLIAESRIKQPLLQLSLFKNRIFACSNFAALFYYMSEFIMVFVSPYFFQKLYGLSAMSSGFMMLPMSITMIIASPISGVIADKFDSRIIGFIGLSLLAVGIVSFGFFDATTPKLLIIIAMSLVGFGAGLFQTPNTSAVMSSAPKEHSGIASSILGTMRTSGMVIGEAIAAAVISFNMNLAAPTLISRGLHGIKLWKSEFLPAAHIACFVGGICVIIAIILSLVRGHVKPALKSVKDAA